jgi:hypothetical protein
MSEKGKKKKKDEKKDKKNKGDKKEVADNKGKKNGTAEDLPSMGPKAAKVKFVGVLFVFTPRLVTLWTAYKRNSQDLINVRWRFIAYNVWWVTAIILILVGTSVGRMISAGGPVKGLMGEQDGKKAGGTANNMAMLLFCLDVYYCFVIASWANEGDVAEKKIRKELRRVSRQDKVDFVRKNDKKDDIGSSIKENEYNTQKALIDEGREEKKGEEGWE